MPGGSRVPTRGGAAIVSLFLAALCGAGPAWALEIIVNSGVMISDISRSHVRQIFSARVTRWEDGSAIRVYVLPDESPLHQEMCKSLLDLCPVSEIPSKEEAVPRWIERRLSACLDEVAAGSRYILVLDDAEVLARYRVPLSVFHRFQGDRRAVVLAVAPGALPEHAGRLPSWTRFDPNQTVAYFQAALGEQCIVASDRRAHAEA